MVPVWMTFSDLFKVMIIQRQITWKWYNIQLYLQWPTNRKSYTVYWTVPFSVTLTQSPSFNVTPFFDAEYLRNGTTYRHNVIEILIGLTHVTSNDLEWLNKIFNDTKHRTVSLQQLSFLYYISVVVTARVPFLDCLHETFVLTGLYHATRFLVCFH